MAWLAQDTYILIHTNPGKVGRDDSDRGRPQAEERQKRFVNGEFIDGVMSMRGSRLPSAFSRLQSC